MSGIYTIKHHTGPSNKNSIKHHIQESQEVSLFPAGDRLLLKYFL